MDALKRRLTHAEHITDAGVAATAACRWTYFEHGEDRRSGHPLHYIVVSTTISTYIGSYWGSRHGIAATGWT